MISISNVSKSFEDIKAVDNVSVSINEKIVFGLLGTNGAGKSTLLRMVSGVLVPDEGSITIDEMPVYDNPEAKKNMYYISDTPYFFANSTPRDMQLYISNQYTDFNQDKFYEYLKTFELGEKRRVNTYSKGMKKQLALLLGICANTKYLLCDETFDGLDPVMRQGVKSIFAKEIDERGLTPVIASHNLRELEDICDHVGLLHKGGVLLSKDLEDMKLNIQRVQCVFSSEEDEARFNEIISSAEATDDEAVNLHQKSIIKEEKRGSLVTYTLRGTRERIDEAFSKVSTVFYEVLPLSLEEIFISETEVVGYDIKKLILG